MRVIARRIGSYDRADETSSVICPAPMAVGAHDLALLDLGQDSVPGPFAHAPADAESLFSQVIELEYERVALPAIDTRMLTKKGNEIGRPL
ncbi:MAG: hypothetical protein WD404_07725 [Solirubrobacterales bacterium]